MLKLNAGFSRKVGEPNFGSRGASVNLELELDSNLIRDSEALCSHIRNLFELARQSVDEELADDRDQAGNGHAPGLVAPANRDNAGRPASPRPGPNGQDIRYATASQLRAIRSICQRQGRDPGQLAHERYRINRIEELTLQEASALIDELKSTAGNGQQKGGRR